MLPFSFFRFMLTHTIKKKKKKKGTSENCHQCLLHVTTKDSEGLLQNASLIGYELQSIQ